MSVPKKRLPAEERREQILQIAAEVFSSKGYRMASVSDIVEQAGIGRGTFYIYFDSKKDIFLELIEKYFRDFADMLEENHRLLQDAFNTRRKVLRTWRDNMLRILEYHRDNPHLTHIAYREALGMDEDFSDKVEELSAMARDKLVYELQMMCDQGMMRECDVEVVTTIIMGSAINVVLQHLLMERGRDIEELADMIMEYNIRALIPDIGDVNRALGSALSNAKTSQGKRPRED
jgi:AcrR family transcriptional regulator